MIDSPAGRLCAWLNSVLRRNYRRVDGYHWELCKPYPNMLKLENGDGEVVDKYVRRCAFPST
jgi:hypothetical protein